MRLSDCVRPHPTHARLNVARRELIRALGDPTISHRQVPSVVDLLGLAPQTLEDITAWVLRGPRKADHESPEKDHSPWLPLQGQG
jgi:hypothetical protein